MAGLREIAEAEGALEQSRLGRPAEWARVTVPAYLVEVADWLDRWATETARDAFIDVGGVKVTLGRPDRPDQWSISQRLVVNVHSTDDKSLLEYELIRRGYRVSASGEVERSLDDLEIVARLAKRDADSPRARVDIGADGIESVDLAKRLLQEIGRRWDCAIEATHLEAERRKDRPHVFEGLPEQPTPEWFPRTEAKQKLWRRKADIMRRMDEEYLGLYEHGEINCATPTTSDYATRLLEQTEDTHNSAETLRNIRKARRMGLI
ncbi:MAG: hypothetical protein GX601_13700 [Anaerolineales bacterium]|nr:hypothetical protein [Anaerolineales bacterium]